ncbi:hypothetical protein D1BOALGB6SA_1439 [Olavius sp. associated proteobacterium Delta 1]|nr:hypothetical protein D1BOALGB6SA_1439 [Olavius sp. associated proteobacterium Delta 1]
MIGVVSCKVHDGSEQGFADNTLLVGHFFLQSYQLIFLFFKKSVFFFKNLL